MLSICLFPSGFPSTSRKLGRHSLLDQALRFPAPSSGPRYRWPLEADSLWNAASTHILPRAEWSGRAVPAIAIASSDENDARLQAAADLLRQLHVQRKALILITHLSSHPRTRETSARLDELRRAGLQTIAAPRDPDFRRLCP